MRREKGVRRMKITKKMLDTDGHSEECEGCRYQQAGMSEQRIHSEECRARMESCAAEDEEGREKVDNQNERINQRLSEEMSKEIEMGEEMEVEEVQEGRTQEEETRVVEPETTDEGDSMMISQIRKASGYQGECSHTERMRKEERRMNEKLGVDIIEMFSPPRVTTEAKNWGFRVGEAMDLTIGWDVNIPEHRRKAEEYVDKNEPLVLIGSPPCVAFSQLQSLSLESDNEAKQLAEGIRHMEFMAKLYKNQVEGGRVFLHENPAHAKSWALPCMKKMAREE